MNNYIKQLVEAFDFNSVKKQNKNVNAVDAVLQSIIWKIYSREKISNDEYDILMKLGYKVSDNNELKKLIYYFIEQFGNECNLNWIDVSNVTDMSNMFYSSKFNGNINQWDVSNVTDMDGMFASSEFNGDISQWNVSNVNNMSWMFNVSKFNGDISQWDVSNVTTMYNMFSGAKFNSDISQWNVSNVTDMQCMFYGSNFNGDISQWNVSNVTDKRRMFNRCPIKSEYKPKFK